MKEHYIYITSSKTEKYDNNKFSEFTVDFPSNIDLSTNNWELGLATIDFSKRGTPSPNMYICCDIISPSYKNNKTAQILRFIGCTKGRGSLSFNPIFYFDVLTKSIDKINIYILSGEDILESFSEETLYCTLHLREKK